jgi:hypothetical protein
MNFKKEVEGYNDKILDITKKILEAGNPSIHYEDLYVISASNRMMGLNESILHLFLSGNQDICFVHLRLLLDTIMRMTAIQITPSSNIFAEKVIKNGKSVRNLKIEGNYLSDRYLMLKMVELFLDQPMSNDPNMEQYIQKLPELYKYLSGNIHFSQTHYFNTIVKHNSQTEKTFLISASKRIPYKIKRHIRMHTTFFNEMFIWFINNWLYTKNYYHPTT